MRNLRSPHLLTPTYMMQLLQEEILQLSGHKPLASANTVAAKACDLDHSFPNQKSSIRRTCPKSPDRHEAPRSHHTAYTEVHLGRVAVRQREFQARLGPYPQGVGHLAGGGSWASGWREKWGLVSEDMRIKTHQQCKFTLRLRIKWA